MGEQHLPVLTIEELTDYIREVFPQTSDMGVRITGLKPEEIEITLKVSQKDLRPGGTISGPTMFTLADVSAYMLILAHIGKVALAVTTSLNINFLRKPEPADLVATAKFLKLGKRLAICDIQIRSENHDAIVAQATATYSIPPR